MASEVQPEFILTRNTADEEHGISNPSYSNPNFDMLQQIELTLSENRDPGSKPPNFR